MIRIRRKSIILQCVLLVGIGSVVFRGFGRERGAIRMAQEKVTNAESIAQEAVLSKEKQDNSTTTIIQEEEEEVLLLQVQGGQVLSRAAMESLADEQTAIDQIEGAIEGATTTTSDDNGTRSASTNTTTTTTRQEEPEQREPHTNSTHNASSILFQQEEHNTTDMHLDLFKQQQPPPVSKKKNHTTVSLVTSFFAAHGATTTMKKQHLHIAEIEMSILTNLHNPHFDQVVVILDGISETSNCTHFKGKMRKKQKEFYAWGEKKRYWNNSAHKPFYHPSKLFCVNRPDEQPSYYEMFQYALNPTIVTGDIIVLANADQAFDDTLQRVQQMTKKSLLTIATRGYHIGEAPKEIVRHFQFTHYKRRQPIISRCGTAMPSWDAYVFYRTLLRGRLKRTDFGRKLVDNHVEMTGKHQFVHKYSNSNKVHKMALFKMNENSAEYSALWALLKAAPSAYATNPCAHIAMWHFHGTTKMHNLGGNRMAKPTYWDWSIDPKRKFRFDLVPPPYQFPTKPYANAFEDLTPQPVPPDSCWPPKHFLSVEQFNEAVKKCSKRMKTLSS